MGDSSAFVAALKRCLKAKGVTYGQLAEALGLSEASVKRVFSQETLTLKRIDAILSALDMTLLDVAKLAATPRDESSSLLTLAQEQALAADPRLFAFFHLVLFGVSPAAIVRRYDVTKDQVSRWLRALEAVDLVELLPRDRVKLRVKRNVLWRDRGPLREAYGPRVLAHFLDGSFDAAGDLRKFVTRRLGAASRAIVARKLTHLLAEVDGLSEIDTRHGDGDADVTGLFVAFRPFSVDGMVALRRRP